MDALMAIGHVTSVGGALVWMVRAAMRKQDLRDKLRSAELTIDVLAPRAYAWDNYLVERRKAAPGLTAQAAAAREGEFRVAYQHLSAECCDDDTPPKPSRWVGLGGA